MGQGAESEGLNNGVDILLQALNARSVRLLQIQILLLSDAFGDEAFG